MASRADNLRAVLCKVIFFGGIEENATSLVQIHSDTTRKKSMADPLER